MFEPEFNVKTPMTPINAKKATTGPIFFVAPEDLSALAEAESCDATFGASAAPCDSTWAFATPFEREPDPEAGICLIR